MIDPKLLPFDVKNIQTTLCGAADNLYVLPRVRQDQAQTADVVQNADCERGFCEHFAGFSDFFGENRSCDGMLPTILKFLSIWRSPGIGGGRVHHRNLARAIES